MSRPIWKGAISFGRSNKWLENVISRQLWEGAISAGLVHISVELHAAITMWILGSAWHSCSPLLLL